MTKGMKEERYKLKEWRKERMKIEKKGREWKNEGSMRGRNEGRMRVLLTLYQHDQVGSNIVYDSALSQRLWPILHIFSDLASLSLF